jgi:hypothetical protein
VFSATFAVGNVTLAGSTYRCDANHDPGGDSNGSSIIIVHS